MTVKIILGDKVIRTSKNLRGILDYGASKRRYDNTHNHFVSSVTIIRNPDEMTEAILLVTWDNTAFCLTHFASFDICVQWCNQRAKLRGWPTPIVYGSSI